MSKFTTQYLVCPPVASRSAVHRLRIDHTRLSIMARVEYCPTLLEGQCGVHGHCRDSRHVAVPDDPEDPKCALWETCLENRQATGGLGRVQFPETVCIFWQPKACWIVVTSSWSWRWANGTSQHSACQWYTLSWHVASVAFRRLTNLDILGWSFIVPSIRSVRIMVTLC